MNRDDDQSDRGGQDVPREEWRETWHHRVYADESYPFAVRLRGDESIVAVGTGFEGDQEEREVVRLALDATADTPQITVEKYAVYEVGRGASGGILALVLALPVGLVLTEMVKLAITDPAQLVENLRFWRQKLSNLLSKFERFGAGEISDSLMRVCALTAFAEDYPHYTPDPERVEVISHVGSHGEGGWARIGTTIVIVPDLGGAGFAMYEMDGMGGVLSHVGRFTRESDLESEIDVRVMLDRPLIRSQALRPQDDPAIAEYGEELAHLPGAQAGDPGEDD